MVIAPGTKLGPYEIVARIGAGGMGEVWKARDTRLDRSVAIKVLPAELAHHPQLRVRFEREARAISQLNHPNICTLFDVGDDFIVMELLEGETLADKIARGPLPIDDVLRYGTEIAEGLDKAHRAGIVHRDLKPGNIMITRTGAKLLDFGLAKASPVSFSDPNLATEAKPLTQEGTIVGTFQYMAPEQLEGLEADARTDIFALGTVLYEMATGRRAFEGKTRMSLIASIVSSQPAPISTIVPVTPPAFDHIVRKCLAKDRDDRMQSAHDIAAELRWIREAGSQAGTPAATTRRRSKERLAWIAATLALLALCVALIARQRMQHEPLIAAAIELPPENSIQSNSPFALSPDGQKLAFFARTPAGAKLCIHALDGSFDKTFDGADAGGPFWSADSATVGFWQRGAIKKVDISGGTPQDVVNVGGNAPAGCFLPDGSMIYSSSTTQGILRIMPDGHTSQVTRVTAGMEHLHPGMLPDGKHFLFYERHVAIGGNEGVRVGNLEKNEIKTVVATCCDGIYVPSGELLYRRGDALFARHFDLDRFELTGAESRVLDSAGFLPGVSRLLVAANDRVLIHERGGIADTELTVVDRFGSVVRTIGKRARYYTPRVSHDGTRVIADLSDPAHGDDGDLWMFDIRRDTSTRFTWEAANESGAVWSPDDSRITFFRDLALAHDLSVIFEKPSSGTSADVQMSPRLVGFPLEWSRDGRYLLYQDRGDIFVFDRQSGVSSPVANTPFTESDAHFSPDGRWIAYISNESGPTEVYVRSFPSAGGKWPVSREGGYAPAWSPDGKELFYLTLDGKMARVAVTANGATFDAGAPVPMFPLELRRLAVRQYDVMPDGQHFVINRRIDGETRSFELIVNWRERISR